MCLFYQTSSSANPPTVGKIIDQLGLGRDDTENKNVEPENSPEPPKIETPQKKLAKTKKSEDQTKFELKKIEITNNTVFSDSELETLYKNHLNTLVTIHDLREIAEKITTHYRDNGYILANVLIPPQEIDEQGIVKIEILEGFIAQVSVEGNKSNSVKKLLMAYGEKIAKNTPLTLQTLERYSLLANDIPGVNVKTFIKKSKTPTAADLVFIVTEKTEGAYFMANNHNSSVLLREQLIGNVHKNNIFSGSQSNFNGVISRRNTMNYIAIFHKQQLNDDGLGWNFNVSNTKTNPSLESIGSPSVYIPGKALLVSTNAEYPFIRSRKKDLIFSGGFKMMNTATNINGIPLFKDHTRSVNLEVKHSFITEEANTNSISFTYSHGFNGFGSIANPPSRIGGKTNFDKAEVTITRNQNLPLQNFSLFLGFKSQYAFTQLLSSETFSYGGIPYGYGYDPGIINGDHGIAARAEFQYYIPIQKLTTSGLQLFACLDTGTIWNINKASQIPHQTGSSVGAGMRAQILKSTLLELALGQPFNKNINSENKKPLRLLFNLKISI